MGSSYCCNCHHQDTIIEWSNGVSEECLMGHKLGTGDCRDYDPIHESLEEYTERMR